MSDVQVDRAGRAGQGDAGRLDRFYEDYARTVYRYIYAKVGKREDAEDLTSQVFLKALRFADSAGDGPGVEAWFFAVARTTVADHWRRFFQASAEPLDRLLEHGWEPPGAAGEPGMTGEARAQSATGPLDISAQVQRILVRLPARYREVLTYRFLLNCSVKESAQRMHLSEANVRVLQYRALQRAAEVGSADEDEG